MNILLLKIGFVNDFEYVMFCVRLVFNVFNGVVMVILLVMVLSWVILYLFVVKLVNMSDIELKKFGVMLVWVVGGSYRFIVVGNEISSIIYVIMVGLKILKLSLL